MDAAQWPQHQQVAGFSRPMEDNIPIPLPNNNSNNNTPTSLSNNNNNSKASSTPLVGGEQRKSRPQKDQNINCPRCNSTNTKFCYYNNYSLTQPRYFCKTCRRYWTQGGSLRNVPVGGGSRKNKRSSSSALSTPSQASISTVKNPSTIPAKLIPDLNPPSSLSHLITSQNPKFLEGQDLNLAFPIQGIFQPTNNENHEPINIMNVNTNGGNTNISTTTSTKTCSTTTTSNTPISALELLRTGIASRGGSLNPYVPMPMPIPMPVPDSSTLYSSGFPNLQDFKPNMSVFSPPGDHNNMVGAGENNGARLLFPFADMNKLASTTTATGADHQQHHNEIDQRQSGNNDHQQHHHQGHAAGYWSGMLGGGTW